MAWSLMGLFFRCLLYALMVLAFIPLLVCICMLSCWVVGCWAVGIMVWAISVVCIPLEDVVGWVILHYDDVNAWFSAIVAGSHVSFF